MGYHLNRLDEPVFMAVSKPLLTEFGIHHRLESCAILQQDNACVLEIRKCRDRVIIFNFRVGGKNKGNSSYIPARNSISRNGENETMGD